VFTSYRGYNGFNNDGVYINTAFNPVTATSPNYLQNSASIGIWSNAVTAESSAQMSQGSSGRSWIYDNFASDGNFYARINNASTGGLTSPGTKGLFVADRSSSGSVVPYWDGSALTAQSGASSTPYSGAFIIGSSVTSGFAGTVQTISEAHIGASLGTTLNLALYNRLRTYMTAVGVP
jgi:hypothetical protein